MNVTLQIGKRMYEVDLTNPMDLAIPMDFSDRQPIVWGVEKACAKTIGDTKRGESCNWQQYTMTPHSNGTHTESLGHITQELFPVNQALKSLLIPSVLISLEPQKDLLITQKALEEKLKLIPNSFCEALIIRTLPNDTSKMSRNYELSPPPYFSKEAMELIVSLNVQHLLVDFPSIDRMHDEGKLQNHRLFWNLPMGVNHLTDQANRHKTVTELIYAPESVPDGLYALNLQIPSFATDAAPSRPLLFRLRSIS